jgi:type III secretory pathway lipoprotein EscJ
MDAHHSSRERSALFNPSQVIALGIVAVSIGWAVWLLRDAPSAEETELLSGTVLPSSEMALMEAAFDRAQLTDYRTDGGRVFVPRSRQSAYMRALVDAEALPREFGVSLRRALANNSPWQSKAAQADVLRVATQEELALVICSMPGIERAAVLYDVEERPGLEAGVRGGPAKTASVNVRTQPDTELDPARVLAIRILVASSIAGLSPERVAVTDLRSGRAFAGPLEQDSDVAATDPALARKIAYERHLAGKLRQSLSFVKGAVIDVAVEFEAAAADDAAPVAPPPPPVPNPDIAAANAPLEIAARPAAPAAARRAAGDMPWAVHVSIAVPDTYFQSALRAAADHGPAAAGSAVSGVSPHGIEQREVDRIRQVVLPLLPTTPNPDNQQVVVTGFPVTPPAAVRRGLATETAAAGAAEPTARPSPAKSAAAFPLAAFLEAQAKSAGLLPADATELPREAWLAATSVCVGLLAGLLWWAGSRRPPAQLPVHASSYRRSARQPHIDWSGIDGRLDSDGDDSVPSPHDGRDFKAAA